MRSCFCVIILFVFGCKIKDRQPEEKKDVVNVDVYNPFYNQIEEAGYFLKDGDLLVRSGTDMASQMIKNFNLKDRSFSHSGIVFFSDDVPHVYHILAGDDNPDTNLVADSLQKFCHPRHNSGFAIYRYDISPVEINKMKEVVFRWHAQEVKFDSAFNLKSDDRMYCSEMIKKALERATDSRITIKTRKPSKIEAMLAASKLPMQAENIMKLDVVPVDNLYLNPHCRLIQRFDFKQQK